MCGCLFQPRKALIADDVFNPAGIGLRSLGVNACCDKLLGKKAMALIDFFGNLAAHIGQMEKVIFVHCEKSQGMKQLMAGGGVALIGMLLVPQLTGLFG